MKRDFGGQNREGNLYKNPWLFFIGLFCSFSILFLVLSPYQFLDGDDALQAIWALCKQKGINPHQFPLHGYETRSGTFLLIYLFSLVLKSPQVSFAVLSALSSALIIPSLVLYVGLILGTRLKPVPLLILLSLIPEVIYAGLYLNAAVVGYGLGFFSIFLSAWFIKNEKPGYYFLISGALYGFALVSAMSSACLAFAIPIQHFFLGERRNVRKTGFRFGVEVLAGLLVYILFLEMMGLSPFSPFKEYPEVTTIYNTPDLRYLTITLLGCLNPWSFFYCFGGVDFDG